MSDRFAPIHLKLGRIYDRLGRTDQARVAYEKYLELAPNAEDYSEVARRISQL
jgi:Flp pilus assembly protein TadD